MKSTNRKREKERNNQNNSEIQRQSQLQCLYLARQSNKNVVDNKVQQIKIHYQGTERERWAKKEKKCVRVFVVKEKKRKEKKREKKKKRKKKRRNKDQNDMEAHFLRYENPESGGRANN